MFKVKHVPKVVGQPESQQQIGFGINAIADLLAPTLGPVGGHVASGPDAGHRVELIDDAATIVRRIISLGDAQKDVGAMVMRSLVWRVGQRAGDGGATAAVLARAIYCDGLRMSTAGVNSARLTRGIERGVRVAIDALRKQTRPISGEDDLAALARTITKDDQLSAVLGEMSYLLGPDAHVVIEKFVAPYLYRRYVAGARIGAEIQSMYFYTEAEQKKSVLTAPAIAILDERLKEASQVVPLMEAAVAQGAKALAIVAMEVSGSALGALVTNHRQPADKRKLQITAVKLKPVGQELKWAMTDLAALTGATVLGPNQVRSGAKAQVDDLGRAQRVEFANNSFVVVAHDSKRAEIQEEIAKLRKFIEDTPFDDEERPKLVKRLSTLTGGVGELKIGANSKGERALREVQSERAFKVLSEAQRGGVVAGGGAALLHCVPALLQAAAQEPDDDVAEGMRVLARALAQPLRQIVVNSFHTAPEVIVNQVREGDTGTTYDALSHRVVDAFEAGILDATDVLAKVVHTAASGAMMALSTDAIVYHKKPKEEMTPG
jgi:chaperonin GroEL